MSSERSSSAIADAWDGLALRQRWPVYALEAAVGAALMITVLFMTVRTSLGPAALVVAGATWLAASALAYVRDRRQGERPPGGYVPFNPSTLFFAVVAATFTVHAMDAVFPPPPHYNPNVPEDIPGLATNFIPYFLVLLAAAVLFVTWYGRTRERDTQAGVLTLVVFTSLTFELMLRTAGTGAAPESSLLHMPMLWGMVLVLVTLWATDERRRGEVWRWTPFGVPLLALLAAGVLSTITSVYVHASATMLLRIGAFAALCLFVANVTRTRRDFWLMWLAIVAPLAGAALVIWIDLWDLYRHMGLNFVLTYRYQLSGIAGTNPAGLSFGMATLFCLGALVMVNDWRQRVGILALLGLLGPVLLATHSPESVVAVLGGLFGLALLRFGPVLLRRRWQLSRRQLAIVAAAAVAVIGLLAIPNPYSSKLVGDVRDPTTGRSARVLAWQIAFDDFRHNPVVGVGLHNYFARTRYVGDYPSTVMTSVRERRVLLGATFDPWKNFVSFHPHNAYLALMEGMGVFGLLALGGLAYALGRQALRLLQHAEGSSAWWTAAVPLAAVATALAWSFVAQGEDITVIAIPFWPLLGLSAAGGRMLLGEEEARGSVRIAAWETLRERIASWWRLPAVRAAAMPALIAVIALSYLTFVARPVAAEMLTSHSDEAFGGNPPKAFRLIEWAHRLDPWNAAYLERLSSAQLAAGGFEQAIRDEEQVVKTRRYYAPDNVRLGWYYWLANDQKGALREFQEAVRLDPWDTTKSSSAYVPLGLAEANAGEYQRALETFSLGFQLSPNSVSDDAWQADTSLDPPVPYIDSIYLQPPADTVPADLQRLILIRLDQPGKRPSPLPPAPSPDYHMTAVFDVMHGDEQAMRRTNPERANQMLTMLGRLSLVLSLPQRGQGYLEELRAATPDSDAAHYSLGLANVATGNVAVAKQEFETVLQIAKGSSNYVLREPFAHFQLGVLALEQQPPNTATALKELKDAKRTYRWEYMPNLFKYLAIAEELQGNRGAATAYLKKELFLLGVGAGVSTSEQAPPETEDIASR